MLLAVTAGGAWIEATALPGTPLFVRAGSIPLVGPDAQYTNEPAGRRRGAVMIGARGGAFEGMAEERVFHIRWIENGDGRASALIRKARPAKAGAPDHFHI